MKRVVCLTIIIGLITSFLCTLAEAKRGPEPKVRPVFYKGLVLVAANNEKKLGYVEAWDFKTAKKIWQKKVYSVFINPVMEADVQWVFISSLEIKNDKLVVVDEKGRRYFVSIPGRVIKDKQNRKIIQLSYGDGSYQSHSFYIDGLISGQSVDRLKTAIRESAQKYPEALYEFISDWKMVTEQIREIRSAVKEAGAKLEHFWVPHSDSVPEKEVGPYGQGWVDLGKD